jgi:hypothetical protein
MKIGAFIIKIFLGPAKQTTTALSLCLVTKLNAPRLTLSFSKELPQTTRSNDLACRFALATLCFANACVFPVDESLRLGEGSGSQTRRSDRHPGALRR